MLKRWLERLLAPIIDRRIQAYDRNMADKVEARIRRPPLQRRR